MKEKITIHFAKEEEGKDRRRNGKVRPDGWGKEMSMEDWMLLGRFVPWAWKQRLVWRCKLCSGEESIVGILSVFYIQQ